MQHRLKRKYEMYVKKPSCFSFLVLLLYTSTCLSTCRRQQTTATILYFLFKKALFLVYLDLFIYLSLSTNYFTFCIFFLQKSFVSLSYLNCRVDNVLCTYREIKREYDIQLDEKGDYSFILIYKNMVYITLYIIYPIKSYNESENLKVGVGKSKVGVTIVVQRLRV